MDKLNLNQHISQQFNEELEDVRSRVLAMGGLVEDQAARAIEALISRNAELASEVVSDDMRVNACEVDIDEECTRIVARRQPAATDLRLVMAVVKTITDLERIGDECKRVAKMVIANPDGAFSEEIRNELEHMGELVRAMLHEVLDAFARTDVETALSVVRADRKVDIKYESITRQLMTYMAQDPQNIPSSLGVLWTARALERVGDRCQNIAEYVIYLVLGKDIRHTRVDDIVEEVQAVQHERTG